MERGNIDFGKLLNGVTTENVYVLTNDNRKVIEALRFLPGNREIKPKKVEDLVKAYQNKEYIPPILISTPFRFVTEGNHRLAAALECLKRNIPFTLRVYFYADEFALETARLINNTQNRWKAHDKLMSYVYEKRESYVLLKRFMDKYSSIFIRNGEYAVQAGLCLLSGGRTRDSLNAAFSRGKLLINENQLELGEAMMDELSLISEILGTRSVYARDHSTGWMKARTRLGIPFTKFIVRLKRRAATWEEPKDSVEAWFNMYMKIASL